MSSRELLNRIGLNEEMPSDLLADAARQPTGHRGRGARRAILNTRNETDSTDNREPHDLILRLLWDRAPDRGDFVTFYSDSRRFQPWPA